MRYASKFGPALVNTLNAIRDRRAFDAGNLTGKPAPYGPSSIGILPRVWEIDILESRNLGTVDYVVHSYATPIAWHLTTGEWVMPQVRYSNSSTRHQTTVRNALRVDYCGRSAAHNVRTHTQAATRRAAEIFA